MNRLSRSLSVVLACLMFNGASGEPPPPTVATASFLTAAPQRRGMIRNGRLIALYGNQLGTAPVGDTAGFVGTFVDTNTDAFGVDDCSTPGVCDLAFKESVTIRNGEIEVFTYIQKIEGLPVYGSVVKIPVHLGAGATPDRIGHVGIRMFERPEQALPADTVTEAQAKQVVDDDPDYDGIDPATFSVATKYIYEDANGALHRAWRFEGSGDEEAYRFFVDTSSGTIVDAKSLIFNATVEGTVTGFSTPCCGADDPDDPATCPIEKYIPGVKVSAGGLSTYTDETGWYSLSGLASGVEVTVSSTLDGEYIEIKNLLGLDLEPDPASQDVTPIDGSPPPRVDFTFNPTDVPCSTPRAEYETAQVNALIAAQHTREWILRLTEREDLFDENIRISVNEDPSGCEVIGYLNPGTMKIYLYGSSDRCNNAASPTVVSHEYGHYITLELLGELVDDAFMEAFADIIAALVWDTPEMFFDHFRNDLPVRDLSGPDVKWNDCRTLPDWCPLWYGEHCQGLSVGGAFWDLREAIGLSATERLFVDFLGITTGYHPASTLADVLEADDDDGNLCNDSDNKQAIIDAFALHGWTWDNDAAVRSRRQRECDLAGSAANAGPATRDGLYG